MEKAERPMNPKNSEIPEWSDELDLLKKIYGLFDNSIAFIPINAMELPTTEIYETMTVVIKAEIEVVADFLLVRHNNGLLTEGSEVGFCW